MSLYKVAMVFEAIDHTTNVIDKIAGGVVGLARDVTRATADVVAKTTNMAGEFSEGVGIMELAARQSGESMDVLREAALRVGDDVTLLGVSATSATEGITNLYKSGLSTTAVFGDLNGYLAGTAELGGVLRDSIDLAAASTLEIGDAADFSVEIMTVFGKELENDAEKAALANKAVNLLVRTADASTAEVEDLSWAFRYSAQAASSAGWSIDELSIALGLMADMGHRGSRGGTQLRNTMLSLANPTEKAKDTLDSLGVSVYDLETGALRPMHDILLDLHTATKDMTEEQRNLALGSVTTKANVGALQDLIAAAPELWDEMATKIETAATLQEYAAVRAGSLEGRVEALGGEIETLGIRIGDGFLPYAKDLIQVFREIVDRHGDDVVGLFGELATVIGPAALQLLALAGEHIPAVLGAGEKLIDLLARFIDWLGRDRTALERTAIQMGLLGGAVAVLSGPLSGLISLAAGVGPALSNAVVGVKLMASGASAAEVASLGWTASLGPLIAGVVALTAVVLAANKAMQVHKEIQEGYAETEGSWGGFLNQQIEMQESAIGVADAYLEKQREIGAIYDEAPGLFRAFTDRQKVVNASTEDLNRTLVQSASSYDDYLSAVNRVNAANVEQVGSYKYINGHMQYMVETVQKDVVPALGRQTFEIMRNAEEMDLGVAGAAAVVGAQEELADAYDLSSEALADLTEAEVASMEASLHNIRILEETGSVTKAEAEMMRDTLIESYEGVSEATRQMGEEHMELVADLWSNYGKTVYDEMGSALENYRTALAEIEAAQGTHNADMIAAANAKADEMIAASERELAITLWNQNEALMRAGEITRDQYMGMRVALTEEYGVILDETQIASDEMTRLTQMWAAGVPGAEEALLYFIANYGEETDRLVAETEADILEQNGLWAALEEGTSLSMAGVQISAQELTRVLAENGGDLAATVAQMQTDLDTSLGAAGTRIERFGQDYDAGMAGIEETTETAMTGSVSQIERFGKDYDTTMAGIEETTEGRLKRVTEEVEAKTGVVASAMTEAQSITGEAFEDITETVGDKVVVITGDLNSLASGAEDSMGRTGSSMLGVITTVSDLATMIDKLPDMHVFKFKIETEGSIPSLPAGPDAYKPGGHQAFAGGTDYAPGGWAVVGEEGPELVELPRGSRVYTTNETKALLTGASGGSRGAFDTGFGLTSELGAGIVAGLEDSRRRVQLWDQGGGGLLAPFVEAWKTRRSEEIGENIAAGLIGGIEQQIADSEDDVDRAVDQVVGAFLDVGSKLGGIAQSVGRMYEKQVIGPLEERLGNVEDLIQGYDDAIEEVEEQIEALEHQAHALLSIGADFGNVASGIARRYQEYVIGPIQQAIGSSTDAIGEYDRSISDTIRLMEQMEKEYASQSEELERQEAVLQDLRAEYDILTGSLEALQDEQAHYVIGSELYRETAGEIMNIREEMERLGLSMSDVDTEIARVLDEMAKVAPDSKAYLELLDEVDRLEGLRAEEIAAQADAMTELAEREEILLRIEKQRGDIAFLQDQLALLDLVKEHGLDASEVLGDMQFGLDADMEKMLEATSKAMQMMIDQAQQEIVSPDSVEYLKMLDKLVHLERERELALMGQASIQAEIEKQQEKLLRIEKQREQIQFMQEQVKLLELIREHGLDANEVLGGMELGLGADMEQVLIATSRAMEQLIGRAQEELEDAGLATPPGDASGDTFNTYYQLSYSAYQREIGETRASDEMAEIRQAARVIR